jgi:hypothetical protein
MRASAAATAALATLLVSLIGCSAGSTESATVKPSADGQAASSYQPSGSSARGLVESVARLVGSEHDPGQITSGPVSFQDTEYSATIFNAGSTTTFTAFAEVVRDVTVQPSSAATIVYQDATTPTLLNGLDRTLWEKAGSPRLQPSRTGIMNFPSGHYSLLPESTGLTYAETQSLPASPAAMYSSIKKGVLSSGPSTLAQEMLNNFAFLLAPAQLTGKQLSAAWQAVSLIPNLQLCGTGEDLSGRRGEGLCVSDGAQRTEVLLDPATAAILGVKLTLLRATPVYPGVAAGSVIQSDSLTRG